MSTENEGDALKRVPATLQGPGGQILARGLLYFDTRKPLAAFWPRVQDIQDKFPSAVAIAPESGGLIAIFDFHECYCEFGGARHFHFLIEKQYPFPKQTKN